MIKKENVRRIKFVGGIFLLIVMCLFFVDSAHAISWKYDLVSAIRAAGKSGKPIMADFYTNWCGWCKKLDKVTYRDKKVNDLAKKFVCVKIDCERDKASAQKYGITGYPTILFFNSEGEVIDKIGGYAEPTVFLRRMNAVLRKTSAPSNKIKAIQERVKSIFNKTKPVSEKTAKKESKKRSTF